MTIVLEGVTKHYGSVTGTVPALLGLDLKVERGECLALVGPNGAGKSTVLGLIAGYLRPGSGAVRIEGLPPADWVRRRGIGYLPEEVALHGRLRLGRALERLALLDGLRGRTRARAVEEALAAVGLEKQAGRRVRALSRGNRQRAGIAQLLLRPRSILLLDEPASGLDPVWRFRLRELVALLRAEEGADGEPRTVVLSSHDLGEVERLADRVAVLRRGRLRALLDVRAGRTREGPATGWLEREVAEMLAEGRGA